MAELSGVQILQNELEKSKEKLKEFNENIKKLTGHENLRGRRNFENQDESFSGRMGRGRGRIFGLAKRGLMEDSGPPVKRRVVGGAFSRLGPAPVQRRVREDSPEDEDRPKRLSVHSSVVATSREAKNRQDIMQEQTKDKEGMQRNRRMFGLLLGTLNKFKTDSKTLESKEEQRRRIDQKLEENAEKEKKKFKQETMQLMEERHLEETRVSRLEQKMEVVQEHADREKEIKKLKHFLCTKTKPRIFWKPRQMNSATENKLKDSIKVVDEMLRTSQDRLEKEIKDVMEREQKREERIKMRLREDGLFLDEGNNDKGNDSREKSVGGGDQKDDEGMIENLTRKNKLESEAEEKTSMKKMKTKRRVVVEEPSDGDGDTEDEGSFKEDIKVEVRQNASRNESPTEKVKSKGDDGSEDESDSESNSDSDDGSNKKSKKGKGVKDRGDDDKTDGDDEESSRVVLYRESSKDKDSSSKDRKSKRDGEERSERRSREEKHSHRHSKHRRDNEKSAVDEEKEERREKKKSKSSDRIVVEEEGERRGRRNPMNLIGEEDDVEMESENNVTM